MSAPCSYARGSWFTDIVLRGGDLAVDGGSVVSGILGTEGLAVAALVLNDGPQFSTVDLSGAEVGGLILLLDGARWAPG